MLNSSSHLPSFTPEGSPNKSLVFYLQVLTILAAVGPSSDVKVDVFATCSTMSGVSGLVTGT